MRSTARPRLFRPTAAASTENGGFRAFADGLVAEHRAAGLFQAVVGALLEAAHEEDFLRLHGVGGVRRVDQQDAALEVGHRAHAGLDEELVHAAVAAAHDDHVLLRALDHGDGVVDRRMDDLHVAVGKIVPQLDGILREQQLHFEAVALEDALRDGGDERQRLRAGKDLHL
jgi:hypothetical protein